MQYLLSALPAIISGASVALLCFVARRVNKIYKDSRRDRHLSKQALLWQLRDVIWSPYYSFAEKQVAFKEYSEHGGNSLTAAHFHELEQAEIKKTKGKENDQLDFTS